MQSDVVLVCFPFAGAGPSFFYDWRDKAGQSLSIHSVAMPGKERRILEPPETDAVQAVSKLIQELTPQLLGKRIIAFGHSMGAILAYEFTRQLQESRSPLLLRALIVSGSPVPWKPRIQRASGLPDRDFLAAVQAFSGFNHPALNDEGLLKMLLPALRADVMLHENYVPPSTPAFDIVVSGMRGVNDELVTAIDVQEWAQVTQGQFNYIEHPGGHMYLTTTGAGIVSHVCDIALAGSA
jgi:surfactin synthase thioesterase subunit